MSKTMELADHLEAIFTSALDDREEIDRLTKENKRLNDLCGRWQHMIDPGTDPGGCANCFAQEWKGGQS